MFFCGTFSVTSNSRMMYAFARDGGIPGHRFFHKVDAKRKSPVRTGESIDVPSPNIVYTSQTGKPSMARMHSELLSRPSKSWQFSRVLGGDIHCDNRTLYLIRYGFAMTLRLNGVIHCFTGVPIALRVIYRERFTRGPFHLGKFSYPVAVTAVCWIMFISIAFILPTANPVNSQTLNYSIVAVGIVITYSVGFWIISARKWFTGPIKQIAGKCCQRRGLPWIANIGCYSQLKHLARM